MTRLRRSLPCALLAAAVIGAPSAQASQADDDGDVQRTLITNVSIFNGTDQDLIVGRDVVVKGDRIEAIVPRGGAGDYDSVIDGRGGYLTPGLIDCHYHAVLGLEPMIMSQAPDTYIASVAIFELGECLDRGVTTVRDAGGNVAGIAMAIDDGYVTGPRIYPSQAVLSQYSGHVDFRNPNERPKEWGGPPDAFEKNGTGLLANGRQQVLAGVRHNLYQGATQIKIAISGGVISFKDPLYVYEFLPEEIEAAVEAADDYGTYVMAHAHSAGSIKRAVAAGVKCFEHISQADEEAVRMMAQAGCHATVQPLTAKQIMDAYPEGDVRHEKAKQAYDNTGQVMEWAKEHALHLSWGTDLLNSIDTRKTQLQDLTSRKPWFSSAQIMIQATGNAGKTIALCGERNPYGPVGVIEPGAMADILIYSKNPLEDVAIVEDFENNLKLIMANGRVHKSRFD